MDMPTTMRLSSELKEKSYEKLPRGISMSALFRWALHVAIDNQREYNQACKDDREMMRVQEWMRVRLEKVLGEKVCEVIRKE